MLQKIFRLSASGTKDLRKAIIACVLTNLALLLPFRVILSFINIFIDAVIYDAPIDKTQLWILFALSMGIALLYFLLYLNEYNKTYTTAYSESANMRIEIAEKMRQLPLSFFNKKDLSELTMNIMGDCANIEHTISHLIPQLIATCFSSAVICVFLAFYNWEMALAIFCIMPISFLLVFGSRKIQSYFSEKHVTAKVEVSKRMQEYLEGIKVVKAYELAGVKSITLEAALTNMKKLAIRFELITGIFVMVAQAILRIGTGFIVLVGASQFLRGSLDISTFIFFLLVSVRIYGPIQSVLTMLPELFYMQVATKRVQQLRDEPVMTGETDVDFKNHDIVLNDISFAYNEGVEVIHEMSLQIPEKSVTALVGPSGSGKSTIAKLIPRFWDVTDGTISVGGNDISTVEPERLMKEMSFVFQDVILFQDTILNNIRVGNPEATDDQVIETAKLARCHEFIMSLPNGYESMLGENGETISGGERQRLSIARALLKSAPIIILDEATASLDPENEVLIQEALGELIRNKTVIVIAHRLKTIENADNIVVLDSGHISEQGTSTALLKNNQLYAKLYHIQTQSQGWTV